MPMILMLAVQKVRYGSAGITVGTKKLFCSMSGDCSKKIFYRSSPRRILQNGNAIIVPSSPGLLWTNTMSRERPGDEATLVGLSMVCHLLP